MLKNWFTDMTFHPFDTQWDVATPRGQLCRVLELQLWKCMEARGAPRWRVDCHLEFEDYIECKRQDKQVKRNLVIEKERRRLYLERKIDEKYAEPPPKHIFHN